MLYAFDLIEYDGDDLRDLSLIVGTRLRELSGRGDYRALYWELPSFGTPPAF